MHYYQAFSVTIATLIVAGGFFYNQDELTDGRTFLGFCAGALIMWPLVYFLWPVALVYLCVKCAANQYAP